MNSNENQTIDRETKEYLKFSDYNKKGKQNGRKLYEPNALKKNIYTTINNIRHEDKVVFRIMKTLFFMGHVEAHKSFLLKRIEDEPNYFRTYQNVEKCKSRSMIEILDTNLSTAKLFLCKMNTTEEKKWKLGYELTYNELTLTTVVNYSNVKKYIKEGTVLTMVDELEGDTVLLGEKEMDKQQWFEFPLRKALDILDGQTMKLMKLKANL